MYLKKLRLISVSVVLSALLVAGTAFAQSASFSLEDVQAQPGETVDITFEVQLEDVHAVELEIHIGDVSAFSDILLNDCLSGNNAFVNDCDIIGANSDIILVTLANANDEGLDSFTGTIGFEVDSNADPAVIPLEFDETITVTDPVDGTGPDVDVEHINGSIEIEAAADDGSELAVTPSSHDFGTINVGDSDSTTFTAENVGDADLDITDVGISGNSQFTIANDGCNGQTLTPGDTCEVDVDFDGDAEGTYSAEITFERDADVNYEAFCEVFGEVAEDNGADEGLTVDFDGGLGTGDAGETLDSTGTVVYEGDTSGSLSCELSGDVFSSNPDPLDFTFAESGSEEFTISCTLPEDAEDGQIYSGLLSCTDEAGEEVYTQDLGCSVTADEPEPTPAVPVPTMQSWGIALFSLIMLAIGGLSIRAFRS